MHLYRKLLIIITICIALFTLYKLADRRQQLQNTPIREHVLKEGLTMFANPSSEFMSVTSHYKNGVQISNASNPRLPVKEFCIKASWQSARSGYYVSMDMIKHVLSRGCRFLDLEIHGKNNAPVVTFQGASNQILLSDVLRTIVSSAFAGPSPNPNDPLFLNFRIYKDDVGPEVYNLVGMAVHNILGTRLYAGKVTGNTSLGDIMGKIVLCCDRSIDPDYLLAKNYTGCQSEYDNSPTCYSLTKFINVETGSDTLRKYSAQMLNGMLTSPPHMNGDGVSNVTIWRLVEPDDSDGYTNTPSLSLVLNYGAQIVGNKFYRPDGQIAIYEAFFNEHRSSFVPFSVALTYARKNM